VLSRARALDEKSLTPADRLTRTALITEVSGQLAEISCGFEEWVVDPLGGPQVEFMSLPDYTRIDTPADAAKFVKRIWAMGIYLEDHVQNLERGLAKDRTASRDAVTKVIDQLNGMVSGPAESLAVWKPSIAEHASWQPADRFKFSDDLKTAINSALIPALKRYRDVLQTEILPKARPQEKAGLAGLPAGAECYRRMIQVHTSLDLSPEEVHKLGLEQVAKYRKDLAELGQKVFGISNVEDIENKLRTDPAMHFSTAQEVETKARESLAKANAAVPSDSSISPRPSARSGGWGVRSAVPTITTTGEGRRMANSAAT
jgi:uncharacterized protein (DUF885 family)